MRVAMLAAELVVLAICQRCCSNRCADVCRLCCAVLCRALRCGNGESLGDDAGIRAGGVSHLPALSQQLVCTTLADRAVLYRALHCCALAVRVVLTLPCAT